jgi:antitoxin component HigA of HigAB toxin-antitoxin module
MLPNEDMLKMWVATNITDDAEKAQLQDRVLQCFNELRESGFYDMDSFKSEETSGEAPNVKKGKKMTRTLVHILRSIMTVQDIVLETLEVIIGVKSKKN